MFGRKKNKAQKPQITREQALTGIPMLNVGVSMRAEKDHTLIVLRVKNLQRPRWRFLARLQPAEFDRHFVLDALGIEVFNQIDGRHSVNELVEQFVIRHKAGRPEAERSVMAFIHMLAVRQIISVVLPDDGR